MRNRISSLVLSSILAVGVATTGCDTYSYPTPQPDEQQMKKNEYVYGDVGGPARQSKNPNTNAPDAATKAIEVKKKLFADDPDTYSKWNQTKSAAAPGASPSIMKPAQDQPAQGSAPQTGAEKAPAK